LLPPPFAVQFVRTKLSSAISALQNFILLQPGIHKSPSEEFE
jgi:hypothetical protein